MLGRPNDGLRLVSTPEDVIQFAIRGIKMTQENNVLPGNGA